MTKLISIKQTFIEFLTAGDLNNAVKIKEAALRFLALNTNLTTKRQAQDHQQKLDYT